MEIKDVIELIKAVSDNGLTGFKIEQGDTKIVIKKEQPAVTAICSFRYYIKGLIRKTEGPFIITRSLCLYGIIVSVQQVSAFTALTVRK